MLKVVARKLNAFVGKQGTQMKDKVREVLIKCVQNTNREAIENQDYDKKIDKFDSIDFALSAIMQIFEELEKENKLLNYKLSSIGNILSMKEPQKPACLAEIKEKLK